MFSKVKQWFKYFWRLRKPHISWQIASVSGGILCGAVLAHFVDIYFFSGYVWLIVGGLLVLSSIVIRHFVAVLVCILAGIVIGAFVGVNALISQKTYEPYYDKNISFTGKVLEDTSFTQSGELQLKLSNIVIANNKMPGTVWVTTYSKMPIKRGDIVHVEGKFDKGFGNMNVAVFNANVIKAERPVPGDFALKIRDSFTEHVYRVMPAKEASLGVSYITGQKQLLSDEFENDLRNLGLIHLAVASGFHLTIVVGFCRRFFANTSRYYAVIMSLLLIWGFLLITGFTTSMMRAALVTIISLIAWYYGRVVHPVVLLLFVAAITVLINPFVIWGDIGWYLSFASFAGVIIIAPLIEKYFWGDAKNVPALRRIVVATVSAQIATFPIIAFTFAQYSPLALVSNLLILPFVSVAMLLTLFASFASFIIPFAAGVLAYPAYITLRYMTVISDFLVATPWAYRDISVSFFGVIVSYALIIIVTFYLWKRTCYSFSKLDALS